MAHIVTVMARSSLQDTGVGTELLDIDAPETGYKVVSDSGVGVDSVSTKITASVSDSGVGQDTLTILNALGLLDLGSGIDTLSTENLIVLTDPSTGAETLYVKSSVGLGESGVGIDSAAALGSDHITIIDSGTGAEIVYVKTGIVISETSIGTDSASIQASMSLSDLGSGSEATMIKALASLQEVGSALDNSVVTIDIGLSETGVGVDVQRITVSLPMTDQGIGVDSTGDAQGLLVTDSGTSLDSLVAQILALLSETGVGTDVAFVGTQEPEPTPATVYCFGGLYGEHLYGECADVGIHITLADFGTGTDQVMVTVQFALTDTAVGTEMMYRDPAYKVIMDSGVGTDSISVTAQVSLKDLHMGEEFFFGSMFGEQLYGEGSEEIIKKSPKERIRITVPLRFEDDGTLQDVISSLKAQLYQVDQGILSDAFAVQVQLPTLLDSGVGVDIVRTLNWVERIDCSLRTMTEILTQLKTYGDLSCTIKTGKDLDGQVRR